MAFDCNKAQFNQVNEREQMQTFKNMNEVKEANKAIGNKWFEPGAMRFFGTRIETGIIKGQYFITSEQPPHGGRTYNVRLIKDSGDIDTVNDSLLNFDSIEQAEELLETLPTKGIT